MNSLDSRHLRVGDTFAQRFTSVGTYQYTVGVRGGVSGHADKFRIEVGEASAATSKTEYVKVSFTDRVFGVDRPVVAIGRNDVVLWSIATMKAPGFAVCGDDHHFDSSQMGANSMYSHAFGTSGEFEWIDPREPGLHGTIMVQDHRCGSREEREAFMAKLRKPTLIMVDGGHARPGKVRISVGQTIFFAVRSASGLAVVDRRLVAAGEGLNPQPLPPVQAAG